VLVRVRPGAPIRRSRSFAAVPLGPKTALSSTSCNPQRSCIVRDRALVTTKFVVILVGILPPRRDCCWYAARPLGQAQMSNAGLHSRSVAGEVLGWQWAAVVAPAAWLPIVAFRSPVRREAKGPSAGLLSSGVLSAGAAASGGRETPDKKWVDPSAARHEEKISRASEASFELLQKNTSRSLAPDFPGQRRHRLKRPRFVHAIGVWLCQSHGTLVHMKTVRGLNTHPIANTGPQFLVERLSA
jgi:hypothetical protein